MSLKASPPPRTRRRRSRRTADARVAEAVVGGALVGLGKDLVGFLGFLEALGLGIAGIAIGVMLHREAPIRLLDVGLGCVLGRGRALRSSPASTSSSPQERGEHARACSPASSERMHRQTDSLRIDRPSRDFRRSSCRPSPLRTRHRRHCRRRLRLPELVRRPAAGPRRPLLRVETLRDAAGRLLERLQPWSRSCSCCRP